MKNTVKIVNATRWRTDHLRAFVLRARDQVFGSDRRPLLVKFRPSRTRLHGRASVGPKIYLAGLGGRLSSTNWLPVSRDFDKVSLACLIVHELSHNAGLRSELDMPGFGAVARERCAWAADLPLELEPARPQLAPRPTYTDKIARIEARTRAWQTKAKRAATALRKLARQRKYLESRLAAAQVKP